MKKNYTKQERQDLTVYLDALEISEDVKKSILDGEVRVFNEFGITTVGDDPDSLNDVYYHELISSLESKYRLKVYGIIDGVCIQGMCCNFALYIGSYDLNNEEDKEEHDYVMSDFPNWIREGMIQTYVTNLCIDEFSEFSEIPFCYKNTKDGKSLRVVK